MTDWKEEKSLHNSSVSDFVSRPPRFNWRDHFVRYGEHRKFYIYCDINASYVAIHQYLQDGMGRPALVANGNAGGRSDAGACLAISYEARAKGVYRGVSLRKAKSIYRDILIFESCLPLYELYADLFDIVLAWVVHPEDIYRGSCDEVAIECLPKRYPLRAFDQVCEIGLDFIQTQTSIPVNLSITKAQEEEISRCSLRYQVLYAMCYLIRDTVRSVLGLRISMSVAPSIALCKSLIEYAKPEVVGEEWVYQTAHEGIAFPYTAGEANGILGPMRIKDLCGVHTVADRLSKVGIVRVKELQDYLDIESLYQITSNKHLSHVLWYMAHGRDDVLAGYLSAIRDRK